MTPRSSAYESAGKQVKATVLVRPKAGILDPQGEAVEASLRKLGFAVASARIGRIVDLELETSDLQEAHAQVERMCTELLANDLIESVEIELAPQ
jgi:phosphoribosylformylglycinamidine synthase PurS subunit